MGRRRFELVDIKFEMVNIRRADSCQGTAFFQQFSGSPLELYFRLDSRFLGSGYDVCFYPDPAIQRNRYKAMCRLAFEILGKHYDVIDWHIAHK